MIKLTTLVDIFDLYVQHLDLHIQNYINIVMFVTGTWQDSERYLSNCVVISCGWYLQSLCTATRVILTKSSKN